MCKCLQSRATKYRSPPAWQQRTHPPTHLPSPPQCPSSPTVPLSESVSTLVLSLLSSPRWAVVFHVQVGRRCENYVVRPEPKPARGGRGLPHMQSGALDNSPGAPVTAALCVQSWSLFNTSGHCYLCRKKKGGGGTWGGWRGRWSNSFGIMVQEKKVSCFTFFYPRCKAMRAVLCGSGFGRATITV